LYPGDGGAIDYDTAAISADPLAVSGNELLSRRSDYQVVVTELLQPTRKGLTRTIELECGSNQGIGYQRRRGQRL